MPGPTTEVLNDDLKALREDLRKVEGSLKDSIHKVELDVRELSTQVKGLLSSVRLVLVLALTSLGGSIWWGATITAELRNLATQVSDLRKVSETHPAAPPSNREVKSVDPPKS